MKLKLLHIFLTLICLNTVTAYATLRQDLADSYTVSFITMQQGLPHNFVEEIYRDSKGYIWIATSASLARYDGYDFISFTPNSPTRHIKSSFVRKVVEDHFGRLWAVSDGGIDIINLTDLSTSLPKDNTGLFEKLSYQPATSITLDNEGNIWLRNTTDILCLSLNKDGSISQILSMPHKTKVSQTIACVKALPQIFPGVMSAIDGKICRLYVENGKINNVSLSPNLEWKPEIYISDFATIDSYIWIASDHGLFSYDTRTGNVKTYNAQGDHNNLSQNFVNSLAVAPDGNLIAGCLNGLNLIKPDTGEIRQLDVSEITGSPHNLNNNFINCLLADEDKLWVGTEGSGINLFAPRYLYSSMLYHDPADPTSLSPNGVNAIYEDGDGTVWVGTVEGGLNRSRKGYDNGFSHFTRESGALTHNSVSAITSDHTGHLWVGTWGGGLCMLNRLDPSHLIRHFNTAPGGQQMGYIGSLTFDPFNNAVWIGVNAGLYVYDLDTEQLTVPFSGAEEVRGTVASVITPDGRLWLGGLGGLYSINLRKGPGNAGYEYRRYPYKLDDKSSLVPEKITSIAVTSDATLWIGTNGNGLYRYNDKDESFSNISTTDGLPNDAIHGIAEDLHGNLWIATYHGLCCMTPDKRFLTFGLNNGLQTEQFYWNAYRRLANGDILFGSVDGMVAIKGLASTHSAPIPVRFTSLSVGNNAVYGNPERCRISENDRQFEIGFSSFDYGGEGNGRYYYRMKGYEKDWKELAPGRHSVAYMNLFPGSYNLEVKYVGQGQNLESAPVSRFEVEIVPNFYRRWWFIVLIILAILAAVGAIYRWRVKDLKRQRNDLQKAVEEGVREISEQKAQVQQLTADRISFFTNITHEFRTPITLIIGPIERAMRLSTNPKVIEQLNFVARNSRYLLSLVNQLMDFRKIESGKMEPVTTKGDIVRILEEIIVPFKVYAMERGIDIRTIFHFPNPILPFNEDMLRKVLTNLIGNAIKFTPDNGTVTIYAALLKTARCGDQSAFYICVSDTGCGLAEGEEEKVFDHFYQGKNQMKYPLIGATDSGIGLYLCRKLVEVYGGTISARNNHNAGCSFRVIVPVADSRIANIQTTTASAAPHQLYSDDDSSDDERLRILVVEDNGDMRAFMRSVLSEKYTVVEAANGEEAMKILESSDIDLIISDLMMPVMDGLELAGKVKENFSLSHIPFIMLTAKTANEARLEGYKKGIDAYILKPFDEEMLLARIHNLLANRRRRTNRFIDDMKVEHLEIEEESRDKKFVDRVMEVLRDNYSNSYFEVGEFAEALGVSRSLLNKKTQSLMGQSPGQLMRTYRLKLAYELIVKNRTTRNINVTEIAFQVGFNDPKYFTRCFTKQYGATPSSIMRGNPPNPPEEVRKSQLEPEMEGEI
ncbi:MAG: response regulator [Muribaculaceae bacterium]|nr:response regulator [Muribaculaceae bacterium]